MSDTVKLIIEIPKPMYESIQNGTYCGNLYEELKNGTLLDTVKAEIFDKAIKDAKSGEGFIFLGRLWRIFDNIGIKDPDDLTHIFDGVTEIPKDAFKGWYTEKLLEQIRAESEDK